MKQSSLVLALVSVLAACGGGGGDGSEPASVAQTGASAPAASSGAASTPASRAQTNETTQITTSPGTPPVQTNETTQTSSPSSSPVQTNQTTQTTSSATPFSAEMTGGPADGDTLRGIARFEVRGTGIRHAELVLVDRPDLTPPPFSVSANHDVAFIDFDTRTLGDGPVTIAVVAFDGLVGESNARVILAMPPRTLKLNNLGPFLPIQPDLILVLRPPPLGFVIR
jgi:hypothetical protein